MNNNEKYMLVALKEAQKAFAKEEVPVGAVLVIDNKIIAKAHNLKDSKKSALYHAEMNVIKKASKNLENWRLEDATLYVTLEPCPMCASAIQQSRIKKVVCGATSNTVDNNNIVKQIFNSTNANQKVEFVEGVMQDECKNILQMFFQNRRTK